MAAERLRALRRLMSKHDPPIGAYVIPSADAHQSEYLADCDQRRAFLSGFTGSAGHAVVFASAAYQWVDGRYFVQAEKELDLSCWTLMKQGLPDVDAMETVIRKELRGSKLVVGFDPFTVSLSLEERLAASGVPLHPVAGPNFVDTVWGSARPARTASPARPLPLRYTGRSVADKLAAVRDKLSAASCAAVLISALDEVAWLFNIRGSDIPFNPIVFAYAVVTQERAVLFIDPAQVADPAVAAHLGKDVSVHAYDGVCAWVRNHVGPGMRVWVDDNKCSVGIRNGISHAVLHFAPTPIELMKATKNATEIAGLRAAHVRDAAAVCKFHCWLERQVADGVAVDEVSAADELERLRSQQPDYVGLSFPTISAVDDHAASPHFHTEAATAKPIRKGSMYLCDSGGQYLDGTTDITRTMHFGTPSAHQKRCFTRVLQGHIALDRAVFPSGTTGQAIDIIARLPLWRDGLDYRHGTGHGVGAYLFVHEGPTLITSRAHPRDSAFAPGMTVTDEPGYYEDGAFGIRIENCLVCVTSKTPHRFGGVDYLGFQHITLVPLDRSLIDLALLSPEEREWVDRYHARCMEKVGPLLEKDPDSLKWLKSNTRPL